MIGALPMLNNIFAQPTSHQALLKLQTGPGQAVLAACAKRIREAQGRVIFSGMGASFFAVLPAVSRLEQQGYPVQAIESAELLHYGIASLRRGDVGVLISRSGGSIEVLRLAEKMRDAGMTRIGVTNLPETKLEHASDLTLRIGSSADQLIAVQTYTGTVLTLLLLAEQVLAGECTRLSDACDAAMPALSSVIEESFHASESWADLLPTDGTLYLLGRGPALASVHEGALLLHETAKAPAVGMSCGQFRHGPVEIVSKEFRAIVFGTSPLTRGMDRSLADDLLRMGAAVRWIGPADGLSGAGQHASSLITWPQITPEFAPALAPIFDIVPLQFAAYRLARWRDITPGDFRYASEITSAESGFPLFESQISPV